MLRSASRSTSIPLLNWSTQAQLPPLRNMHCEPGIGNTINRTGDAWVDQSTICEHLVTLFVDCMLQLVRTGTCNKTLLNRYNIRRFNVTSHLSIKNHLG